MTTYILQATLLCGWIVLLFFFAGRALDGEGLLYIIGAAVMTVLTVAVVIGAASQEENKGPCLKKETAYTYNAGTKTMMPYTKCVDRGEWVNNG
jgi:hypothetical protein